MELECGVAHLATSSASVRVCECPSVRVFEWDNSAPVFPKEVVAEIKAQNPSFKVVAVPEGSPVTMDYSTERVRVYYNKEGVVAS